MTKFEKLTTFRPAAGKTFSVAITGDFCPYSAIKVEDVASICSDIAPTLAAADYRIMQFETVLTKGDPKPILKCGPNIKSDVASSLEFLKTLNIDLTLLANNHTGDFGPDAAIETRSILRDAGYATAGMGVDPEDAAKPHCFELSGKKIAVLNFCENEFGIVRENDYAGSNPLQPYVNMEQIREAKKTADFVIVTVHGGHEFFPYPSRRMIDTYRAFVDAGANLVFNCHTHCVLGAEYYKGVPIFYSPGNFFFPEKCNELPDMWSGGVLPTFHFDEQGVCAMGLQPYTFTFEKIAPLSPEKEAIFFKDYNELSEVIQQPEELKRLFNIWSVYATDRLAAYIFEGHFPMGFPPDNKVKGWLLFRNLFNCETHDDATRTYLRLVEQGRIEELKPLFDQVIKPLQTPAWL